MRPTVPGGRSRLIRPESVRTGNSIGIRTPRRSFNSGFAPFNSEAGLNQHLEPVTQMFWMRQGLDLSPRGA
jgi:hypothetical protein